MITTKLHYRVSTFREAGLEAKWSKTQSGRPYLVAKQVSSKTWFVITARMFERMKKVGVFNAFEEHTLLGDVLSISAR
jgi:hypothetical protein